MNEPTHEELSNEERRDIANAAIEHFGPGRQMAKFMEEAAEAMVAVAHWIDGRCNDATLASELADVIVMANQVGMIAGLPVGKYIDAKMLRLMQRIEFEQEQQRASEQQST